ncbi:MAG: TlpA disulfide reductase family protein [Pseudomonadota bacterium]
MMLRTLSAALYGLAVLIATPAAAIEDDLLTGTMTRMEVLDPQPAPIVPYYQADGDAGRLSDYAGKVVVLNFWATWCAPCRAEMPSLQALDTAFDGQGLEVVTIAFGRHNPMQMEKFWNDVGITSLPLHLDASTQLAKSLGVRGLPHTFVLDRQGQIIAQLQGEADWAAPETLALMRSVLER